MRRITPISRLAALCLAAALAAPAAAAPPPPPTIAAKDRQAIVDDVAAALNETYVFPETAKKMEEHVRRQLASGAYDRLATLDAFTDKLTEDLQSVSKDLHLGVHWQPEEPAPAGGTALTPEQQRERQRAAIRRDNYCFRKIERLAGNVGYLRLDCFAPAELGGATAVAAMGFLAGSDALIFDLRPAAAPISDEYQVKGYPVVVSLPFGRAVNPISGTNWEGSGVEPDIAVPAAEALEVAHAKALAVIAEKATDPRIKAEAEFTRGLLEDRRAPATLSASEMQAYVGSYGPRVVSLADGVLWYQRQGGPKVRLQAAGQDRFLVGDLDFFRVRFERDAAGKVARLVGLYLDGTEEPHAREGG